MTMFAVIAAFERKIMLERQREGIALAKAQGKYRDAKRQSSLQTGQSLLESINVEKFQP